MNMLTHVPLTEGVSILREHVSEIIWRGRSLFLCAGCEETLPNFRVSLITDQDCNSRPASSKLRRVALAFEANENTRKWSEKHDVELLLPPPAVVLELGDKTLLPEILDGARLPSIPHIVYDPAQPLAAREIWRQLGDAPLVVQQPENNLTGKGTKLVENCFSLQQTLAEWGVAKLKIASYLTGSSLTISGCVGPTRTVVSAMSKQLVGISCLTSYWGAHCGNQLVDSTELGAEVAIKCADVCQRIGDELRRRGFVGVFGLDLLLTTDNDVFVIEINPRLQSVTSLINVHEVESGLLPLPGVHLLSFLTPELPVVEFNGPTPPLSQLVLYAKRRGILAKVATTGRYILKNGIAKQADGPVSLMDLTSEEALVWVFQAPGDCVEEDTRLCVIQVRFGLVGADASVLTDIALQWVEAVESLFAYREES
jgi:predicted ATP-grasp superfamily ATP-dependent carboligase